MIEGTKNVLVLGDQLTVEVGPLSDADPDKTRIIMIESMELAEELPHHKQKLVHVFSSMRHFAQSRRKDGFDVFYREAEESFETGLAAFLEENTGATITMMAPSDRPYVERFTKIVEKYGGSLSIVPNALWITTDDEFDSWAEGRKSLRLEYFYREIRKSRDILMDDGEPEGGEWNYDSMNRKKPPKGHEFPIPKTYHPDALTSEVIAFVDETFPDHFGTSDGFSWPVSREDALNELSHFCSTRLRDFGAYEDAMLSGDSVLNHSTLSPLINTGLLHPREVIDAAITTYKNEENEIPINSIEGFVRQILGWREFIYHIYRTKPELADANVLEHDGKLPSFYWTGDTKMNCVRISIEQLKASGYNHHIQRLMVLGNLAMMLRVDPQEVLAWFTACYIDALDWVMVPNVMGMSQFADGGEFTSKPYAASANYINKMSDYCSGCEYDRSDRVGENACPFNALYWGFLAHHEKRFSENGRMNLVMANWRNQNDDARKALIEKAEEIRDDFCE